MLLDSLDSYPEGYVPCNCHPETCNHKDGMIFIGTPKPKKKSTKKSDDYKRGYKNGYKKGKKDGHAEGYLCAANFYST